jgi:hypothetical protein
MLAKRLFRFGYETPAQSSRNAEHGWDDESSSAFWILSGSDEEAMSWGCIVVEQFTSSLFKTAGQPDYSWKGAEFSHWIETDVNDLPAAENLPVVSIGTIPDFADLSSYH